MEYWAKPRMAQDQIVLFSPTLDDSISDDRVGGRCGGTPWDGQRRSPPPLEYHEASPLPLELAPAEGPTAKSWRESPAQAQRNDREVGQVVFCVRCGKRQVLFRRLDYKETSKDQRGGMMVSRRVYRCADCAGCALASECLDPKAKRGRTVQRDEHEPLREKMAANPAIRDNSNL